MASEQRPTRDELKQGLSVAIGDQHKLIIGWGVRFLRGGKPALVVSPLPALVVGRLSRWGKRPSDDDLVEVEVPNGAQRVQLKAGSKSADVTLAGTKSEKKILFWHGSSGDLGGAAWDDIQLVDVSASGDVPFEPIVEAEADQSKGKLGLVDVLAEDPEHEGQKRTLRYGLFRTRTPKLTFVLPNLDVPDLDIWLDDGDEATEDEVNLTKHLSLSDEVSAVEIPGFVKLNQSAVRGTTNEETEEGRSRIFVETLDDQKPAEGDCALFVFGGNRVRIERRGERLFTASSFHYLDDAEPIPSGYAPPVEVTEEDDVKLSVAKDCLVLDFDDAADDARLSQILHALRFAPRAFDGTYNVVEGRATEPLDADALKAKRKELLDLGDPDVTDVGYACLLAPGEVRLERVPTNLHADFVAANHTFTNADLHWHHFVIHTFPAHRLIESVILPQRRPPISALGGGHFDTAKTFILPTAADDLRHVLRVVDENGEAKAAVFGHTDTVDSAVRNEALSLLRAQSMVALLRHDVGFWYDRFGKSSETCGSARRELEYALRETGDYSGPIDGNDTADFRSALDAFRGRAGTGGSGATANEATRRALAKEVRAKIGSKGAALTDEKAWGPVEIKHMYTLAGHASVRDFQKAEGLSDDGDVGLCTRVALCRAYQGKLVATAVAADRFHPDAVFGCGEAFATTPDNTASELDRRVEVLLRRSAVPNPGGVVPKGAAVPYLEWRAPEPDGTQGDAPPSVVVAVTDTGFGSGDNLTGEQLTQPNHLFIKGERWIKPTTTAAASVANPTLSLVRQDGDLTLVSDVGMAIPGGGHGTTVATCLGADGVGNAPRTARTTVLGTAPHVKLRPIAISAAGGGANYFSYMNALKAIADDPDVLVYTTSVGSFSVNLGFTATQRRALKERAQEIAMKGKLIFAIPQNYNGNFQSLYHAQHTQWGSISASSTSTRSKLSGANEYQQFLTIVGNSGRVGPLAPTTTPAPGAFETVTASSYIGEQVWVYMPGHDIRALEPLLANGSLGLSNSVPAGSDLVGGTTGVSFATPLTAGVAAELILLDSTLRQKQNLRRIPEYLRATADPLPRMSATAGSGAPANPRQGDPLINNNANHAAFYNLHRINFWKAALAALNQGLANEGRGAAGATDAFYGFCTLKDDAATTWYGFEIRSLIADAVVWFERPDGSFVLAEDGGALYPGNRVAGGAWRNVQAYQQLSAAGATAVGSAAENLPLPAFPFATAAFGGAQRQYFLCQLSIKKDELAKFRSLVIAMPGVDPGGPAGRQTPPLLALRVDNRPGLRVPQGLGGAIGDFVEDFDDFVFHVSMKPMTIDRWVLVADGGRTGVGQNEKVGIRIHAVDKYGNFAHVAAPAAGTLSDDGTGVSIDGTATGGAGTVVVHAAPDPWGLIRCQFEDSAVEKVTLTFTAAGKTGTLALDVAAAGAATGFGVVVQKRGGGAKVAGTNVLAGELLEVVVTAEDQGGRAVTTATGRVKLSVVTGEPGRNGPPQPRGVHVATNLRDPYSAAAFEADLVNGQVTFPLIVYTPGTVKLHAAKGALGGDSVDLHVVPAALKAFRVQATTPQTAGTGFQVTVTAEDEFANVKDDFTGAVTMSVAAGTAGALGPPRAGVFLGDTATVAADDTHTFDRSEGGIHRFPVTCYTAENVQLKATAGAISGTSSAIAVQGGGAVDHFRFDIRGADRAGSQFECKVIAEDAAGHRLPGFAAAVTLSLVQGTPFTMPGPRGVRILGSPYTYVAADNGEHTFRVTPHSAEKIQLQAASGGVTSQSAVLTIGGGAFARFKVVPIAPRLNSAFTVQVTAEDSTGNPVTDFLGTVTLSVNRGATRTAIGGASHTFVASDGGVFLFNVTLTQKGAGQTIDADDGNVRTASAPFNLA